MIETYHQKSTKLCATCRDDKPLDDFNKDRSRSDGRHPICRKCTQQRRKELRSNPEATRKRKSSPNVSPQKGHKICIDCGQEKSVEQFVKTRNQCKDCQRNYDRERAKTERRRKQRSDYFQAHKAESRISGVKSYQKHREQYCEKDARRYAKRFNIPLPKVDYSAILTRDKSVCHICDMAIMPGDIHFDHVVPLSRGGAHSQENIKMAHRICNLRKGNHLMEELPPSLRRGIA